MVKIGAYVKGVFFFFRLLVLPKILANEKKAFAEISRDGLLLKNYWFYYLR